MQHPNLLIRRYFFAILRNTLSQILRHSVALPATKRHFQNTIPTMRQPPTNNLPDTILRSWHRCTDLGVIEDQIPYAEPLTHNELLILREASGELLPMVEPELDFLGEMFQGTDSVVLLANPNGMILDTRGTGTFLDKAGQVALKSGVVWSESERGTNAIGTAIAERYGRSLGQ